MVVKIFPAQMISPEQEVAVVEELPVHMRHDQLSGIMSSLVTKPGEEVMPVASIVNIIPIRRLRETGFWEISPMMMVVDFIR